MTPQRQQSKPAQTPPPKPDAQSAEPVLPPEQVAPPTQEQTPPEPEPEPYWADYGDAPAPLEINPRAAVELLLQVRDLANLMIVDGAPAPPRVGKGDAVLRVHLELFDQTGSRFQQPTDIPLAGFATPEAVQLGLQTAQAALSTLVIRPLMSKLTTYLDSTRNQSAHNEVPLTVYRPPSRERRDDDDDLETARVIDTRE